MRLRHKIGCEDQIKNSIHYIDVNYDNYKILDFYQIFHNHNKVYIELGTGKGQFLCNLAHINPNINYIGIDKYATVLLKAIKNIDNFFESQKENINIKFLCIDIKNIKSIFKKNSIDKIFLNFSDPWPKKRHENRRLTSHRFLEIYDYLLKNNGIIEFKTDNLLLFNFSLNEIKKFGFKIIQFTFDLHNDIILNKNNIMTEYEEKFSKKGNKICKLIAIKGGNYG